MNNILTDDELRRYSRHLLLPRFGMAGQLRLKESGVLLIGAGGLGSPLALYLAAAGVGRIGIVDYDVVDETNLHRQILHHTPSLGRLKVDSAKERLRQINPQVETVIYPERFTRGNAMAIADGYDVIADGSDNFATRYLVNDLCVLLGKPNVQGAVSRFEGHLSVFDARRGPCYRCLHRQPPPPDTVPNCAETGVLGVLPGVIGTLQATEVIKLLTGIGEPLIGRLLLYDALKMRFHEIRIAKDPDCPVCGERASITELADYDELCGSAINNYGLPMAEDLNGRASTTNNRQPAIRNNTMDIPEITVEQLDRMRKDQEPHVLIDVREVEEYNIGNLGGVLIPISEFQERHDEVPREGRVIVYCRTGNRSGRVVAYLRQLGYTNVENLAGGIVAWAQRIDGAIAV